MLHLLFVALRHAVMLGDQVDENAEVRQHDHEDDPCGFAPAREVATPEHVAEDGDQEPEPDHPREEHEHRPHHIEKWVRTGYHDQSPLPNRLRSAPKTSWSQSA